MALGKVGQQLLPNSSRGYGFDMVKAMHRVTVESATALDRSERKA